MDVEKAQEEEYRPSQWRKVLGSIWTKPGEAAHYLSRMEPELFMHRLWMFTGVCLMVCIRMPVWLYQGPDPFGFMIQMLFLGPVMGLMAGYIFGAVVRNYIRWRGGTIDRESTRTILAWTNLPFAIGYLVTAATYAACYYILKGQPGFRGWILGVSWLGWLPVLVLALFWIWGFWARVRAIASAGYLPKKDAAVVVVLSFFSFYGPLSALGFVYYTIMIQALRVAAS